MNLVQKTVALLVSEEVNIWHFHGKAENPRFFFWLASEPGNTEGYGFDTYEAMVEAAYARIDPLLKPIPPVGVLTPGAVGAER